MVWAYDCQRILHRTIPDQFQYDVFLSHSAKDKAVVRPLAERLRKDGLKVWFDEWVLKAGDSIPAKIEEGLEHSRVLVLCMSAHAFGSDWAQLEAGTFRFRDPLNKERRFIPLRLDDAHTKEIFPGRKLIDEKFNDHTLGPSPDLVSIEDIDSFRFIQIVQGERCDAERGSQKPTTY